MRLINADDVVKYCCGYFGHCTHECTKCGFANSVRNIPTAYDVEKVLEELEKYRKLCFLTLANTGDEQLDIVYDYVSSAIDNAIDIVKRGCMNWAG